MLIPRHNTCLETFFSITRITCAIHIDIIVHATVVIRRDVEP
jgi:hypothetical protein